MGLTNPTYAQGSFLLLSRVGYVVAHCWRWGGSLQDMWWLISGDELAHCWRCGGSLLEIWWLIAGDVVAQCLSCDGSLLEMWSWKIACDVITYSLPEMRWLNARDVLVHCWRCVFLLFQEKNKDKSKVILGWFWTEILYVRPVYTVYYLTNTIGNPADQLCVGGGERERKPPWLILTQDS